MAHVLDVPVILEANRLAFADEMSFPQCVAALQQIGVERYAADLVQLEKTHYSAGGDSVTEPLPLRDVPPIAYAFSADAVVAALRSIQQRQLDYPQVLRRIMTAGCVRYWVFLEGRRAVYLGRRGEFHVENFPPGE